MTFRSPETIERIRERLEAQAGVGLEPLLSAALTESPDPDASLINLERWLTATSSPWVYLTQLSADHELATHLLTMLGASQTMADTLIQNPELAAALLDPVELSRPVSRTGIVAEGHGLLVSSNSYRHRLDRLRFLKQRWTAAITLNDLAGRWAPPIVWRALSDLADALIELAVDVVWEQMAAEKGLQPKAPILVIGFGKLGGGELNYSSDVDLAYVAPDGDGALLERHGVRFCELLGYALSEKMGRGSLFRVDLRLRPYGGTGPILNSMSAVEAYYRLYGEPWEIQALLRSRPLTGPADLAARWDALREHHCFKPRVSDIALQQMREMWARIEGSADAADLKRGPGGIREVEFPVQILQLLHGYRTPTVRGRAVLEVIEALRAGGVVTEAQASTLSEAYTLLRQLEHRCQLLGDHQTHSVPSSAEGKERLAKSMRLASWKVLESNLTPLRRGIHKLSTILIGPGASPDANREKVMKFLGGHGPACALWLDAFPGGDDLYASILQNEGSLRRLRTVLVEAPKLVDAFRSSYVLTEMLLSGEIEENLKSPDTLNDLPATSSVNQLADAFNIGWYGACVRWLLEPSFELGQELSGLMDVLLANCARRLNANFDIVALGSYGRRELCPSSDADLLLLVSEPALHDRAEQQAADLLSLLDKLKRLGIPISVDLRLRPEGSRGLLARTYDGFSAYDLDGMEMWERFALGMARGVWGAKEAPALVGRVAYALPLTPDRLKELLEMKRRIENERLKPQYRHRDVKLGEGSLTDLEWFVHLLEMRYPAVRCEGRCPDMEERIRALGREGLINAIERDELLQARRYLLDIRARLAFLGVSEGILPENPHKLGLLASAVGARDANDLLLRHHRITRTVRNIFVEGMEGLK